MKSLVDNLFEYTKVKTNGTPLSISKIDLNQMMEQLVASFELEADKSGLAISAQETDQPMYIES